MSERKDLTRWNRAGLSRFTYVDGNAVEYLELLRRELAARFTGIDQPVPPETVPENEIQKAGETLLDEQKRQHTRAQRILQMYRSDRRDWAWEISRTFARACHILTGYADAWANEGYLGTATQWDDVRRLVGLLDYYPAPPASATTPLVLMAKKGMSGTVAKGFQVKNSPIMGAEKVVFETLDDLVIDESLNQLRPKGWNKSDKPAVDDPNPGPRQFSELAQLDAICIQGVGPEWAEVLKKKSSIEKISDFFDADPENLVTSLAGTGIGLDRLWEFKAKAMTVCNFLPGSEWASILDWSLPEIVLEDSAALSELTGNSLESTEALQLGVALLGACLDQQNYQGATLRQLQAPTLETSYLQSPWRAGNKPRVESGQVALVYHRSKNEAEAVTITKVDADTKIIHVRPSPVQYTWHKWPLGEAVLRAVPRWKRKCWLIGSDVVRTEEAHGLAAGSYICWKDKDDHYQYANVVKADKRSLQLELGGKSKLPEAGTKIMVAIPVATDIMSADLDAINAVAAKAKIKDTKLELPAAPDLPFQVYKIFQTSSTSPSGGGGGGLLPPASLPGIGSFLFPSPLLPIDLVKAAIEMMLSMGIMVIPSTGIPVFKGMPFGGSLEAPDIPAAADKMMELLNNLVLPAKWGASGYLVDNQEGKPVYLEALCENGTVPTRQRYVDYRGVVLTIPPGQQIPLGLKCSNGKVVDGLDKPIGFQPYYLEVGKTVQPPVDQSFDFQMVAWDKAVTDKKKKMEDTLKGGDPTVLFKTIEIGANPVDEGALPEPLLAVLKGASVVRAVVARQNPLYVFDGTPDNIAPSDWVVGQFKNDVLGALKIKTVEDYSGDGAEKAFSLTFESVPGSVGGLEKIHADFADERIAEGAYINTTQLGDKIELDAVSATLTPGRKVLLTTTDGKKPVEAKIVSIDGNTVTTDPPASNFNKGELIICGNVVKASHGVSKPPVILGSGDAAKSNQEFTFEVQGVTFTPDATMSSGVAAAIDVEVAGRIWEQVSTLKDSAPCDHHYAVRMTEEGYVKILFGDGQKGQRLPTEKNNVRLRYRTGSGLAGNVAAHSLEKPVNQHPLVEVVLQPVKAAGGGDMESAASLRENAPSSLLALERAVSLSDFADLATSRSNIWQAKARAEVAHTSRMERVTVTVVPAGGVSSDDIIKDVRQFLQVHAMPNVQVAVEKFTPATDFKMEILIRVKSAEYLPAEIVKAVIAALKDRFALQRGKLGANLYLSEVYKVVEGVKGVENSVCRLIQGTDTRQVIEANDECTVVYLDSRKLKVDPEEYLP